MPDAASEREALVLFEKMLVVPEDQRDRWIEEQAGGAPEISARLRALRDADRIASLRTGGAADAVIEQRPPDHIGAYKLVGLIGRGGMGSVYRAERMRGDFKHIAAVKLIKPGLLSEALVERFQRERQLLARLSHPNIAQLYDGGETDEGSPFIIMEYVEGLPLLAWLVEHRPGRTVRQRLFADICAAVAHAHRNLIVHRDITPSNVLVNSDGVVKLIDFGISRLAEETSQEAGNAGSTSLPGLSLTPGYAAPERFARTSVTTLSDIYSLGKILEKLMAEELGDPELGAVIDRAVETEPQKRYSTVEALSADVDAWSNGLPVAAVGGSRSYILRKFVARHRLAVMASICALALLVAALLVTLGANRRAEAARVDAEQRFDQTRAIARTMLFDAFDEVSKVTGGTKAREILARSGLHYLDALAVDDAAPTDVRAEVVRGYTRLAQVMGSGQSGQLGKLADSNTLLGKAEAVAAPLYAAHPNDPAVIRARADLLIEQSGTNLYNNNKITLAREQAIEVQRLLERFARKEAESARIYATAIQAEADSHGWDNDYSKAREAHLRAERFVAGLPPKLGADREVLKVRSANLRLLAEAHHRLKQEGEAVQAIQRAVSINEALLRAAPDDPGQIRKLAISRWYGAVVHRTNGRNAVAREWIERAVELARSLRARDPNDAGALHLFALTGEVQAQVLADSRRFSDSFAVGADVVAAHRRLVKLSGNTAGARRSMATSLSTLGENQRAGGALGLACTSWREALAVLRGLEHAGSLSEFDRKNGLPELRKLLATHCSGGPA